MADLSPGRELDAAVAAKVMGWHDVKFQPIANAFGEKVLDEYAGHPPNDLLKNAIIPKYSSNIQFAWEVLEKLKSISVFAAVISAKGQPWVCKVNKDTAFVEERADAAPLAICKAALKAVSEE
ncbi:MAG TPA: hypothetical protein VF950_23820 [Planctomycetota bacterium]